MHRLHFVDSFRLVLQNNHLPRFHSRIDAKIFETAHLMYQLSYLLSQWPMALGKMLISTAGSHGRA